MQRGWLIFQGEEDQREEGGRDQRARYINKQDVAGKCVEGRRITVITTRMEDGKAGRREGQKVIEEQE